VKAGSPEVAWEVAAQLPGYFSGRVLAELEKRASPSPAASETALRLFAPSTPPGSEVAESMREDSVDTMHLHEVLDEIESSENIRISHYQASMVRQSLEEDRVELAARSELVGQGDSEDLKKLDRDEVMDILRRLGFA
jgi:hypothetical protein